MGNYTEPCLRGPCGSHRVLEPAEPGHRRDPRIHGGAATPTLACDPTSHGRGYVRWFPCNQVGDGPRTGYRPQIECTRTHTHTHTHGQTSSSFRASAISPHVTSAPSRLQMRRNGRLPTVVRGARKSFPVKSIRRARSLAITGGPAHPTQGGGGENTTSIPFHRIHFRPPETQLHNGE